MAPEIALLTASMSLLLVSAVSWRLNRNVQPLRVEMVRKADALLARPDLPDDIRVLVEDDVRTVFGMRARLLLGLPLIPFVALVFLFRQRWLPDMKRNLASLSPGDRELFHEVSGLHDRITLMNHVVLYPIVVAELFLCVLPALIVRSVLRASVEEPGSADVVRDVIEHSHYRRGRPLGPTTGMAC